MDVRVVVVEVALEAVDVAVVVVLPGLRSARRSAMMMTRLSLW